jgi:circadian clock protein KaiB
VKARAPTKAKPSKTSTTNWSLWLYVAGPTPRSFVAFRNLQQLCDEHLGGCYSIKVIDLIKNPQIARDDQIIAVPAVIRKRPSPTRRVIGDLSNTERVLAVLDFPPRASFPRTSL